MPSFDIVCRVDLQEVRNAVDQARREVATRFDLKDSGAEVELHEEGADRGIVVLAPDESTAERVVDVVIGKLVRRGVDPLFFDRGAPRPAGGGRTRVVLALKEGVPQELAKRLVKEIKGLKLKVQAQIRGEELRVSGKKRDDLQQVIAHLKGLDVDRPLLFTNFRD